jgi:hypothetical protein
VRSKDIAETSTFLQAVGNTGEIGGSVERGLVPEGLTREWNGNC